MGKRAVVHNESNGDQLRQYIERVERLEEDRTEIASVIREIYQEAKSNGYDPKVMRKIVSMRKMDPHTANEQETLLHIYKKISRDVTIKH